MVWRLTTTTNNLPPNQSTTFREREKTSAFDVRLPNFLLFLLSAEPAVPLQNADIRSFGVTKCRFPFWKAYSGLMAGLRCPSGSIHKVRHHPPPALMKPPSAWMEACGSAGIWPGESGEHVSKHLLSSDRFLSQVLQPQPLAQLPHALLRCLCLCQHLNFVPGPYYGKFLPSFWQVKLCSLDLFLITYQRSSNSHKSFSLALWVLFFIHKIAMLAVPGFLCFLRVRRMKGRIALVSDLPDWEPLRDEARIKF